MSSTRNIPTGSSVRTTDDVILDAAREAILAVGWSRVTLTDIARRAGVSRMTLYRRWPDTGSLLADLVTREWALVLGTVLEDSGHGSWLDRLVDGVCDSVRSIRRNALMKRIIELDPELLLPYLVERRGRAQDLVVDVMVGQIREGQQEGSIRAGSPTVLARTILLTASGFTLSAHTMGKAGDYDTELRRLILGYLHP